MVKTRTKKKPNRSDRRKICLTVPSRFFPVPSTSQIIASFRLQALHKEQRMLSLPKQPYHEKPTGKDNIPRISRKQHKLFNASCFSPNHPTLFCSRSACLSKRSVLSIQRFRFFDLK